MYDPLRDIKVFAQACFYKARAPLSHVFDWRQWKIPWDGGGALKNQNSWNYTTWITRSLLFEWKEILNMMEPKNYGHI